jgi:hypothetical protein
MSPFPFPMVSPYPMASESHQLLLDAVHKTIPAAMAPSSPLALSQSKSGFDGKLMYSLYDVSCLYFVGGFLGNPTAFDAVIPTFILENLPFPKAALPVRFHHFFK